MTCRGQRRRRAKKPRQAISTARAAAQRTADGASATIVQQEQPGAKQSERGDDAAGDLLFFQGDGAEPHRRASIAAAIGCSDSCDHRHGVTASARSHAMRHRGRRGRRCNAVASTVALRSTTARLRPPRNGHPDRQAENTRAECEQARAASLHPPPQARCFSIHRAEQLTPARGNGETTNLYQARRRRTCFQVGRMGPQRAGFRARRLRYSRAVGRRPEEQAKIAPPPTSPGLGRPPMPSED